LTAAADLITHSKPAGEDEASLGFLKTSGGEGGVRGVGVTDPKRLVLTGAFVLAEAA